MNVNQDNQHESKPNGKKHYLLILACAALVYITVNLLNKQLLSSAYPVSEALGGIAALVLLPFLAIHFIGNTAGWIVFFIFSFGYINNKLGSKNQDVESTAFIESEQIKSYLYTSQYCDFSVKFPGPPDIKKLSVPNIGSFDQASWQSKKSNDSVILKAECIPSKKLVDSLSYGNINENLISLLENYSKANGLSSIEFELVDSAIGKSAKARGYKTIQNVPVTYQINVILGASSILILYAGGASATYPQAEVIPFLSSAEKA